MDCTSDAYKALRILDAAVARVKWMEQALYTINGNIPQDLSKEVEELNWLIGQLELEIEGNGE